MKLDLCCRGIYIIQIGVSEVSVSSAPEAGGGLQITACVPGAGCWSGG